MGEEVEAQEFSRADRTRYREKVRRCLDVFARMLREARFDTDDPMTGLEVELNLVDERGDPALKNTEALAAIADPAFQTELGLFNIEINVPPVKLREGGLETFEELLRSDLNGAEAKSAEVGAHMVMIGILPTLAADHMTAESISPNPRYKLLGEQILNARGEDISIQIAGIGNVERLETTTDSIVPEAACTSTQFHVQTSPDSFAEYWNASQAICAIQLALVRELAVPPRPGAVARDPDPAVRAVHRHPRRGAQGAGRAAAGVVRGALDQLGLRPVRGERPLLPGAAPDHRRRGPARGARGRRGAASSPSCGCTTARSTAGTGRSTTSPGECRTCGSRTASWPPARRWPTPSPTPPSTSGWSARSPRASGRCGRRCRSAPRRRTSTWRPSTASTPRSTGPASARCAATELTLRRLLPLAREGLADVGRGERDQRPAARDHRAALPARDQRRRVVRPPDAPALRHGAVRRAAGDAAGVPRADAHQRAGAHLGLGRRGRTRAQVRHSPLRGSRQPRRLTTTNASGAPASAYAARAAESHRASTSCSSSPPLRVSHTSWSGPAPARTRSAATTSVRSPGSVGSAVSTGSEATAPAGDADVQDRRVDAAPFAAPRGRAPPAAAARGSAAPAVRSARPRLWPPRSRRRSTHALHRSRRDDIR